MLEYECNHHPLEVSFLHASHALNPCLFAGSSTEVYWIVSQDHTQRNEAVVDTHHAGILQ